jgi:hypothetical protein
MLRQLGWPFSRSNPPAVDADDYFAVINATTFTLVAKGWVTDPSSPACNPEVYVNFAPDGNGDFPVTQRGFQDGSFRLAVGPSTPPEPTWDMYFSGTYRGGSHSHIS